MDRKFIRKYCMKCESRCYYREPPIVDMKQTLKLGCLYTVEGCEDMQKCPKGIKEKGNGNE